MTELTRTTQGGTGRAREVQVFDATSSKVTQGSIYLTNTLWLPNLAWPPDRRITQCWVEWSCRGHPGPTRLLRNAVQPPNWVTASDRNVTHCWGQRSHKGHPDSSSGPMALKLSMATKFDGKNPWCECNIWYLFPQNERQVAKFHFQIITRFILFRLLALKWYMSGSLPIWGPKNNYFFEKFLCFLLIFEMFSEPYLL